MSTTLRPTKKWAPMALAGAMSALLAAPMSLGTATASTANTPNEKPILTVANVRPGVVALHALTKPGLEYADINFYKLVHGEKKYVGYAVTGAAGRAHIRVHLRPGTMHRFVARWVRVDGGRFHASNPNIPRRSRYSNVVRHRIPS